MLASLYFSDFTKFSQIAKFKWRWNKIFAIFLHDQFNFKKYTLKFFVCVKSTKIKWR